MEMTQRRELVDNFELISDLLDFSKPNNFYMVQILKRRKENPDMKTGVKTINVYFIYSFNEFNILRDKIIDDCISNNARAYINLNYRDTYMIALYTQKIITEYMLSGNFKAVQDAYTKACGNNHSDKNTKWLIDIDIIDSEGNPDRNLMDCAKHMIEVITELHKETKSNYKILCLVPTRNGYHIITNPFNKQKFGNIFTHINTKDDITDNSPTVLYINGNKDAKLERNNG